MATPRISPTAGSTIIPGMRYKNAPAAIDWLCNAFGFEKHLVVPGENNSILHAELSFGSGMIMLGSFRKEEGPGSPAEPDIDSQGIYVVVADCDAHYARAKAAGAQIVTEIRDEAHGGRGYACKDLESRLWYFGSYSPWHP